MSATPPLDPAYSPQPEDGSVGAGRVPWWCSWPVVIVLECFFFVPAIVVVWLRPFTSRRTKWTATAILVAIPALATILDYVLYP
jgi:hypothetical protein